MGDMIILGIEQGNGQYLVTPTESQDYFFIGYNPYRIGGRREMHNMLVAVQGAYPEQPILDISDFSTRPEIFESLKRAADLRDTHRVDSRMFGGRYDLTDGLLQLFDPAIEKVKPSEEILKQLHTALSQYKPQNGKRIYQVKIQGLDLS